MIKLMLEAKQVGLLYRTVDIRHIRQILATDCMISPPDNILCCTRDKTYYEHTRGTGITFVLDGDLISNNYKIYPYRNSGEYWSKKSEYEERIQGPLHNVHKYTVEVLIRDTYKTNELIAIRLEQQGFKDYDDFIEAMENKGYKITEVHIKES